MLRRKKKSAPKSGRRKQILVCTLIPGGWISTAEEGRWETLGEVICVSVSAPAALPSATSAAHEAGLYQKITPLLQTVAGKQLSQSPTLSATAF